MTKKYFEVEVHHTGTKIFHIPITDTMSEKEALKYIAEKYVDLEQDYNPYGEHGETTVLSISYREEK